MIDKPPRQSIRTLIRKGLKARYSLPVSITTGGEVFAGGLRFSDVSDWRTTRSDAGSVRLYDRHNLIFTFGPGA